MKHIKTVLLFIVLSLQGTTSFAAEAALSSDYLERKWSNGGKEGCTSDLAGYVIFHNNRVVQAGIGKSVRAVGFWELSDDTVIMHLLVSPRNRKKEHPFYQEKYHYQYMAPKILRIQSDNFDYTIESAAQAGEKKMLTRCQ